MSEETTNESTEVAIEVESRTYDDGTIATGVSPLPDESPAAPPVAGPVTIHPTIGRKVWFRPNGASFHSNPHEIDAETPMDADVVYVWSDRMVNLTVKDHIGQVHAFTSVTLLQPGDQKPAGGAYAEWMPYQVGQAKAA